MAVKNSLPPWVRVIIFFITYNILIGIVALIFYKLSFELIFVDKNGKDFFIIVDQAIKDQKFAYLLAIQLLINTIFTVLFLRLFKLTFDPKISDLLMAIKSINIPGFLKGAFLGFILILIPACILWIKGDIVLQYASFPGSYILYFTIIYLCVGFMEEIINRGYILVHLIKSVGRWPGIVLSSLFFSLIHLFNNSFSLIAGLNLLLGGILLAIIFLYTKNLWYVIGIHFAWNFTQGIILGFNVSGFENFGILTWKNIGEQQWTGGYFGLEGSLLTMIMLIAIIIFLTIRSSFSKNTS